MNDEQRKKLKALKSQNKEYIKKLQWEKNALLQECLKAIKNYSIINDEITINQLLEIANDTKIVHHSDRPTLEKNHSYYVVWDDEQVPIIKCNGNDILNNWDDVIAVALYTCFVDYENNHSILIKG